MTVAEQSRVVPIVQRGRVDERLHETELEGVLGLTAPVPVEQSYESFLNQFPSLQRQNQDSPAESVVPTSDAAGVEASAPADEHEMAEEKLPKGNSSGFFLDAPAMAQVGNFVQDGGEESEECEEENEYLKAGGGARAQAAASPAISSPPHSSAEASRPRKAQVTMARPPPPAPPEVDPDDIPEYSIGEQDERGESVHLLQNEPARSLQEHDFNSPDNESSPFNDGAGLKSICGVPGMVGEEQESHSEHSHCREDKEALDMIASLYLNPDDSHEEAEGEKACQGENDTSLGESDDGPGLKAEDFASDTEIKDGDAVTRFQLDPDFDYENVECTPNPMKAMREEWTARNRSGSQC
mmetsp:Transcript_12964/g.24710  ORF Transcript_12964/g.24710 Transcript_12964/m.24710 type:complete len:354 (-) Transcript_12964:185-1246(-)